MDSFARQLTQMRPALLRTAHRRLKNAGWAEDAVSETLLAALEREPDFSEQTRVRAWLFGILRHKVVDQLRHHLGPERSFAAIESAETESHERCDPCPRSDPMHRLVGQQFLNALKVQLERLPSLHADAFVLRECQDRDTAEICLALAITANHLGVVLHRARHRLRENLADHVA
jgi:RNA polymerase sigma-70 factor (ECF subfamily)